MSNSLVHKASDDNQPELVKLLLANGASWDSTDVVRVLCELVPVLCERGCDLVLLIQKQTHIQRIIIYEIG